MRNRYTRNQRRKKIDYTFLSIPRITYIFVYAPNKIYSLTKIFKSPVLNPTTEYSAQLFYYLR